MTGELRDNPRISYLAVASFVVALLWYAGWAVALAFAVVGLKDPQGWNWLPYGVWGKFALPVPVLSTILGTWSLGSIRVRSGALTGNEFAIAGVILSSLAWPMWWMAPEIVNLWK